MKPLKEFSVMTPKLNRASEKAHVLDDTIQEILSRQEHKDRRFRLSAYILLGLVLSLGVIGIFEQNHIANQNKQHIDCVVKLFTTPLPVTYRSRTITNPGTTCDIRFSK